MFFTFELMASFSFNIKIKKIDQKKHVHAAALGAFSTTLFMILAISAPLIAKDTTAWFIIAGAFMMAAGNVTSLLLLRPFENWINSRREKNEIKEVS